MSSPLEVVELGAGEDLVVFVHGVLDRGRSFRFVAEELAGECQMLWYDRRGYGSALDPGQEPGGVEGHATDLLEVLAGRPAVLVGHSFGGVSALVAALRAPALARAVVLYETGMAWSPGWDDGHMQAVLWGDDPEETGLRLMFGERVEAMTPQERTTWLLEARAFVAEERSVRRGPPPMELSRLAVPLVYGCSDRSRFSSVAAYLGHEVPGVEIVELPGAGHNAHRSQPAAFADLVRRGIARSHDAA